jgi:RNA 2',3'-cyclic 3'-phosphodiesterase
MMRTFVALNLPQAERARLHDALAPLRDRGLPVRWVAPEALHITLRFLGDTEADAVPHIERVLADAAARRSPLTLEIAGLGAFPSLRRASIIWIGVNQEPELHALQKHLEPALSRLGFPRETRPFRPHITVGRIRSGSRAIDIDRARELVDYSAAVEVATVDLMQSHQSSAGSRYERLLSRRLGEK